MKELSIVSSETHLMEVPSGLDDEEDLAQFSLDEHEEDDERELNAAPSSSEGGGGGGGGEGSSSDLVGESVVQFTTQQAYRHAEATKRELWSWISYDWANSVYSSVSIVLLIPLLLDTLAFEAGVNPEGGGPCLPANATAGQEQLCRVSILGGSVDSTAFSLYMISISVGIQALLFISLGSLADYGALRKRLMIGFAIAGAVFAVLFVIPTAGTLWLAGLLTVLSNACFGVSIVFYNAFLPLLVEAHPDMRRLEASGVTAVEELSRRSQEVSNKLSTYGFVAGYISGTLLLLVCAGIIFAMGQGSTAAMKIGIALSGVWWGGFTLLPAFFLKERPGPPLPRGQYWFLVSWRQLFRSFLAIRRIPRTFLYLFSYFIFSDAYSTISSVAVLFGRREMHLDNTKLVIIAIVVPFSALFGNLLFLYVQRLLKVETKRMLIATLVLLALIPAYGLVGLVSDSFGLRTEAEMYALGVYYGLLLGPVQSLSRVFFAELIPPGQESEFFGLYEITDKGSSWIGPAAIAAITDSSGEIRLGLVYLLVALVVSIPMLLFIDAAKGKEDAIRLTKGPSSPSLEE